MANYCRAVLKSLRGTASVTSYERKAWPGTLLDPWLLSGKDSEKSVTYKNESNLLLVRITVCIESCLPIGWHTFIWWKNPPKFWSILVWIAGCWNSLLMSCNPKNNWCLSRIFGARFGGKDRSLSTCKPWSKQAGGWIHFWMKRLITLNSYQILKIKNKI